MRLLGFLWISIFGLFAGCADHEVLGLENAGGEEAGSSNLMVRIAAPQEHIDSAHVFFFRSLGNTDTLILQKMIYDITYLQPHTFQFELPAGKYSMWVFGNVPTRYLVAEPPYSSDHVYFDYQGGHEPSAVVFGRNVTTAGTDTANLSSMLFLTSFVGLTIREVPDGVDHIIVRLLNTASGITLNGYIKEAMNPPLADTVYSVQKDSTYFSDFYCFPGVGTDSRSTLEVDCLSADNQVLYSGTSTPFEARASYEYKIACSFGTQVLQNKRGLVPTLPLQIIFNAQEE